MTENREEESSVPNLQVLRACAIVSAEFHDLQKFDPEFLVSNSVVSEDWPCTRYRRLPRRVEIDFDSVEWRMTERELRIELFPEVSWEETMTSDVCNLIPHFVRQFLVSVPQLAAPSVCFYWEIAVGRPDPEQWMRANFAPRVLPRGYVVTEVTTSFVTVKEDLRIRVDVDVEEADGEYGSEPRSIVFDCYGTSRQELVLNQLEHETERWPEYADAVREVVLTVLEGRQKDDTT